MEPLYCGHLGDLVKCLVYSGTPLLWTPWGPGKVEPLYCGHLGDLVKCLVYSGTLYCGHLGDLVKCPVYSGNPLLWTPWGPGKVSCIERCPHLRGKLTGALISGCPLTGVPHSWDIAKCP